MGTIFMQIVGKALGLLRYPEKMCKIRRRISLGEDHSLIVKKRNFQNKLRWEGSQVWASRGQEKR